MTRTTRTTTRLFLIAALIAAATACGRPSSGSAVIGPKGGVVSTSSGFALSIPAGALSSEVEIHVTEVQPNDGSTHRFEIEPNDLPLQSKAHVSMKEGADDGPMKLVGKEGETEETLENEHENTTEHTREADVDHLCDIEMRHQRTCNPGCDAGFECDDGVCKAHAEDPSTTTCNPACTTGFHCESGACVADPNDAGPCPTGFELDPSDGTCKPSGRHG
jgi:hypothetical protein